jgi:GT2 family glycosyltransferase
MTDRSATADQSLGIVVIGRNEGARLVKCLGSLSTLGAPIVYADSNSSDCSVANARNAGAAVVTLSETDGPLNAASGRNAGFKLLREKHPDVAFVQFIDGDCIIESGWVSTARDVLERNPRVAVVCGRRREAFKEHSFYNRLADEEWNTPIGEAPACGGDALMRVAALEEVGLFDAGLRAGEEPELCFRLRQRGWKIWRIDAPMTVHDMAMTTLGQWMRRARRSGQGYAQAFARTRGGAQPLYRRQLISAMLWAVGIPAAAILMAIIVRQPLVLLTAPALYAAQIARMASRRGIGALASWHYGALMLGSKFAEALGALDVWSAPSERNLGGKSA